MIIAGEASGDMRAAGLARALKKLDPTLRLPALAASICVRQGLNVLRISLSLR